MVLRGVIKDGQVHLPEPVPLPDGTIVNVEPARAPVRKPSVRAKAPTRSKATRARRRTRTSGTLFDRLKPVIGKSRSRITDASTNLDHYLYGAARR